MNRGKHLYEGTCPCGATIKTDISDVYFQWLTQHDAKHCEIVSKS